MALGRTAEAEDAQDGRAADRDPLRLVRPGDARGLPAFRAPSRIRSFLPLPLILSFRPLPRILFFAPRREPLPARRPTPRAGLPAHRVRLAVRSGIQDPLRALRMGGGRGEPAPAGPDVSHHPTRPRARHDTRLLPAPRHPPNRLKYDRRSAPPLGTKRGTQGQTEEAAPRGPPSRRNLSQEAHRRSGHTREHKPQTYSNQPRCAPGINMAINARFTGPDGRNHPFFARHRCRIGPKACSPPTGCGRPPTRTTTRGGPPGPEGTHAPGDEYGPY